MLRDYISNTLIDPSKDLEWYEEYEYQGGTPLGYESVNVLDPILGITITFTTKPTRQ